MNDEKDAKVAEVQDEKPEASSEVKENEAETAAKNAAPADPPSTAPTEAAGKQPGKKRFGRLRAWGQRKVGRFKRWQVTGVVCLVVFAAAGGGMLVWHESPSFCGAICHASMDGYLPTYEAEPGGVAGVFAWV